MACRDPGLPAARPFLLLFLKASSGEKVLVVSFTQTQVVNELTMLSSKVHFRVCQTTQTRSLPPCSECLTWLIIPAGTSNGFSKAMSIVMSTSLDSLLSIPEARNGQKQKE